MSYQVLARKWRPQMFSQLMGQTHVVSALSNALNNERLHHAYLFTGTRGVGKTTIARIFSKSLNCINGVTAEPCGECQNCVSIEEGRFVDLVEIDAASRTKVEDTREILDNVQYRPTQGRYKVYLIDEVHMLSRHSFNALLKTLEEPPPHVKFLLATTDPQKLPVTILSRCLQFSLKALTVTQIEQQLTRVLSAEQIAFEDSAINQLATAANGSVRDALSLTDQAIAQGNGEVRADIIRDMLGMLDEQNISELLTALVESNFTEVMNALEHLSASAVEPEQVILELLNCFHQMALIQVLPSYQRFNPKLASVLSQYAQVLSPEHIQLNYQILLKGRKELAYAANPQSGLEMTLLRVLAFTPSEYAPLDDNRDSGMANQPVIASASLGSQQALQAAKSVLTPEEPNKTQATEQAGGLHQRLMAHGQSDINVESEPAAQTQVNSLGQMGATLGKSNELQQENHNIEQSPNSYNQALNKDLPQQNIQQQNQTQTQPQEAEQASPQFIESLEAQQAQIESLARTQSPQFTETSESNYHVQQAPMSEQSPTVSDVSQNDAIATADNTNDITQVSVVNDMLAGIRRQREGGKDESGNQAQNSQQSNSTGQGDASSVKKSELSSEAVQAQQNAQPNQYAKPQHDDTARQGKTSMKDIPLVVSQDAIAEAAATSSELSAQENTESGSDESTAQTFAHGASLEQNMGSSAAVPSASGGDYFVEHNEYADYQQYSQANNGASALTEQDLNPVEQMEALSIEQKVREGIVKSAEVDIWALLVDSAELTGLQRQFALHSTLERIDNTVILTIEAEQAHLNTESNQQKISHALNNLWQTQIVLDVRIAPKRQVTPFNIQKTIDVERLAYAKELIANDPNVNALQQTFSAVVIEDSIKAK